MVRSCSPEVAKHNTSATTGETRSRLWAPTSRGSGIPKAATPRYLLLVSRSPRSRLVTLLIAVLGVLAAPASAVAHGVVHLREATGHGETQGHAVGVERPADHALPHAHIDAVVGGGDSQENDHPHWNLGAVIAARSVALLVAVVPPRVTLPNAPERLVSPVQPQAVVEGRSSPEDRAPPRLRGPPAFPG